MANPAVRPRFLAPGDRLGKFDLIRQIAVGGMAELYLARTMGIEGFEKLVVVKRILPQYSENQSFVNMFLHEARLSATLHHPNITQVYDIGVEDGDYFFSMEYVHGEDLGRVIVTAIESGVPMSMDSALTMIVGLCAGLHYAHEKAGPDGTPLNVVHRDVSPSNVLVSYEGGVKLVDFGIARAGSQPAQTKGGLKGKIAYMSPEQCRGKAALDRRSDVFSIGTILYELTTGQLPFTDETEYGVLNQIVNTDAPPPSSLVPQYPPALEAIVMKALARDVDKRYASALELQGQLEDFAHENRLRVSPLVLARLMSTLFPARLEEWDHARAQGAFFVEQHVVRTLIESGKTSDNTNVVAAIDEETTAITALGTGSASPFADEGSTSGEITSAGVEFTGSHAAGAPALIETLPGAAPTTGARLARSTPQPRMATPIPGGVPIQRPLAPMPAGGGVLVSNPSPTNDATPVPAPPTIDVTERVRIPTPLPQRIDQGFGVQPPVKKSRRPLVLGGIAAIAIASVVAVMTLGGSSETTTKQSVASPEPETTKPVAAEPVAVEPVAAEPVAVEPVAAEQIAVNPVAAKPVVIEPVAAKPVAAKQIAVNPVAAKPVAAKPVAVREPVKLAPVKATSRVVDKRKAAKPTKKPAAELTAKKIDPPNKPEVATPVKVEPKPRKEPAWNDDSPFMPVRTDKR